MRSPWWSVWLVVVPAVVLLLLGVGDPQPSMGAAWVVVSALVGVVAGMLWQVLYRSDLVDKLLAPTAFVVGGTVVSGVLGSGQVGADGLMYCLGVVVGALAGEKYRRWHDRPRPPFEAVSGRPGAVRGSDAR